MEELVAFREELALYHALLKRKEELLERLERAKEVLSGSSGVRGPQRGWQARRP
jgi:hypothetical protein